MAFSDILQAQNDPFQWLEEVDSPASMQWVNEHNQKSMDILGSRPEYNDVYDKALEIYNSSDRIAVPAINGKFIYNFWQDATHERGIWRRSPAAAYDSGEPVWETLLDIDALSKAEGKNWVFKGANGLYPDYHLFLVSLSAGGGDAVETREFDIRTKTFVKGGFNIPESKGDVTWLDANTLIVSTDFGEGTMTTSGYPRQVRRWKRGTDLSDAALLLDIEPTELGAWGSVSWQEKHKYLLVIRAMTFFSQIHYAVEKGKPIQLKLPDDVKLFGILNDQVILQLRSEWNPQGVTYPVGAVLSVDYRSLLKGKYRITEIITPDARSSIDQVSFTKNHLAMVIIRNVKSELHTFHWEGDHWERLQVEAPDFGTIDIIAADNHTDRYYFYFHNMLSPLTLYMSSADKPGIQKIKSLPAYFDASRFETVQYEARSKDGTMIPYFMVAAKDRVLDGSNPTLIYGYGGFEIPTMPFYHGLIGYAYLEKGGVYVLANIRGGGEFGPKWHQAALKENRQKAYDDFHAIAEDLIARKITSPKYIGIFGGSNGGLLTGVAFTQRPDLYQAVVCAVPLLDMQRYNKLLAGASWVGEYGDPDKPEEWAYISRYSPYHNLKKGMKYPEVFFYTSTRDDRVHPGHARKMAAKMEDMGYKVYYYENTEGGHAGSATNEQRARIAALQYTYLWMKLGKGE